MEHTLNLKKYKVLSGSVLKTIAVFSMLLDQITNNWLLVRR